MDRKRTPWLEMGAQPAPLRPVVSFLMLALAAEPQNSVAKRNCDGPITHRSLDRNQALLFEVL
jgi:hypothetical protein